MATHCSSVDHSETNYVAVVIDKLKRPNTIPRKIRESGWIRTRGTTQPGGMDVRVDTL